MAKRRTERMQDKPMAARRGGYLRQQRRDTDENQAPQSNGYQNNRGERRSEGLQGNSFKSW